MKRDPVDALDIIFAVTGGRKFNDAAMVDVAMRRWVQPGNARALVIEGGAPGLDTLVRKWCHRNGVHFAEVPALWDWYNKGAGAIRNGVMLRMKPDFLLAFPGGKGTANCVQQALLAGISVKQAAA